MISPYPEANAADLDPEVESNIETLIEIIHSIRNVRAQYKMESSQWVEAKIYINKNVSEITDYAEAIETLAKARPIAFFMEKRD